MALMGIVEGREYIWRLLLIITVRSCISTAIPTAINNRHYSYCVLFYLIITKTKSILLVKCIVYISKTKSIT